MWAFWTPRISCSSDARAYSRGERVAVCDKTFRLLIQEPYAGLFLPIEPNEQIPLDDAKQFDCKRNKLRHPRESKGMDYDETRVSTEGVCGPGNCC